MSESVPVVEDRRIVLTQEQFEVDSSELPFGGVFTEAAIAEPAHVEKVLPNSQLYAYATEDGKYRLTEEATVQKPDTMSLEWESHPMTKLSDQRNLLVQTNKGMVAVKNNQILDLSSKLVVREEQPGDLPEIDTRHPWELITDDNELTYDVEGLILDHGTYDNAETLPAGCIILDASDRDPLEIAERQIAQIENDHSAVDVAAVSDNISIRPVAAPMIALTAPTAETQNPHPAAKRQKLRDRIRDSWAFLAAKIATFDAGEYFGDQDKGGRRVIGAAAGAVAIAATTYYALKGLGVMGTEHLGGANKSALAHQTLANAQAHGGSGLEITKSRPSSTTHVHHAAAVHTASKSHNGLEVSKSRASHTPAQPHTTAHHKTTARSASSAHDGLKTTASRSSHSAIVHNSGKSSSHSAITTVHAPNSAPTVKVYAGNNPWTISEHRLGLSNHNLTPHQLARIALMDQHIMHINHMNAYMAEHLQIGSKLKV